MRGEVHLLIRALDVDPGRGCPHGYVHAAPDGAARLGPLDLSLGDARADALLQRRRRLRRARCVLEHPGHGHQRPLALAYRAAGVALRGHSALYAGSREVANESPQQRHRQQRAQALLWCWLDPQASAARTNCPEFCTVGIPTVQIWFVGRENRSTLSPRLPMEQRGENRDDFLQQTITRRSSVTTHTTCVTPPLPPHAHTPRAVMRGPAATIEDVRAGGRRKAGRAEESGGSRGRDGRRWAGVTALSCDGRLLTAGCIAVRPQQPRHPPTTFHHVRAQGRDQER